ncbi:MAG TPA: GH25 family lysozyme [Polyangia bacterium]|jgi:lysozyme
MRTTLLIALLASSGCLAGPGDRAVGSLDEAATMCPNGATVSGIDVSGYQGTVDWAQVAASGRKFAIAKATEGVTFTDSTFATNWAAMKSHGILRSAYHFFHSNDDPVAQAHYFVDAMGPLDANDLPPMLDLEVTDGEPAATVASTALTWLKTVEQLTGRKPIVYTYPDFWQNQISQPAGFTGYPLNIANYGVTCPNVVGSWATWTMWQNSSTGSVPGVSGNVDEDTFNGSATALMQFAGGSGTPDPCLGLYDGSYCGGDGITGDKNTLFVCKNSAVASMTPCSAGCVYNPPGTPDACNPAPASDDGGTAGPNDDGGTIDPGAGPGNDAGGGNGLNGGGGNGSSMMGATAGGCSLAGPTSSSSGAAALAIFFLFALALRRRASA